MIRDESGIEGEKVWARLGLCGFAMRPARVGLHLRDVDGGWVYPAYGTHVAIESIDPTEGFDGPTIHGG